MRKLSDRVYRVLRPDGTWRGSGYDGGRGRNAVKAKLWHSAADLVRHFKLPGSPRDSLESKLKEGDAEGDVVIEYRLEEVSRTPVLDFLKQREARR